MKTSPQTPDIFCVYIYIYNNHRDTQRKSSDHQQNPSSVATMVAPLALKTRPVLAHFFPYMSDEAATKDLM